MLSIHPSINVESVPMLIPVILLCSVYDSLFHHLLLSCREEMLSYGSMASVKVLVALSQCCLGYN